MKLIPIHTQCKPVLCPTLYWTDRGTVVVQGFDVSDAESVPQSPSGESWVEVPISLLREGLSRMGEPLQ